MITDNHRQARKSDVLSVVVCDHVYQHLMQSDCLCCLWSSVIMSMNNSWSLTFCVVCGRLWSRLSTTHAVYLSVLFVVICDHVYQQLMQSTFLCCMWSSVIMSINKSCSLTFCLVCGRLWSRLSTTHEVWLSVLSVIVCDHVYQQLMKSDFLCCLWSSVIMSDRKVDCMSCW
jgi:lipoprotein signal peptidase